MSPAWNGSPRFLTALHTLLWASLPDACPPPPLPPFWLPLSPIASAGFSAQRPRILNLQACTLLSSWMCYSWRVLLASDTQHTSLDTSSTPPAWTRMNKSNRWAGEDSQQTNKFKKYDCSTEGHRRCCGNRTGKRRGSNRFCRSYSQRFNDIIYLLLNFIFKVKI